MISLNLAEIASLEGEERAVFENSSRVAPHNQKGRTARTVTAELPL